MVCPSCGAANSADAKFCGECAVPLVGAAAPAQSASSGAGSVDAGQGPVAERRLVSVLFADLVGFTPYAEERDAEEVRDTLTRYFDLASGIIERHGGTVEKFIGDAVMAVWGAPTAHEDDAERAVRAGLELVDAVRTLGPTIQARAGILAGEVAVTLAAKNQGMVAGDLVNTAARLQSVAQPGTVLVGEAIQRAASSSITFEPAGEQVLKGKGAPVTAWRALRVVAERGGRGRSDMLEAPFVGRDDELRLLKDLYLATIREGRIRHVSVTGMGGIGKSRLTWEFQKYLDGMVETAWWHRGRSPAYGAGIAFWSLGEMIRGRAGLAEADTEQTTRTKIAALLDGLTLTDAEHRWIEPALLVLLGIETGMGSEQLFGAWRMFFERLAATCPVVLVFEDLQWADAGTLDFIDHILEWSRAVPIYIVTLARPELLDRRPDWGAGRRSFTSLYLEPLHESATRDLLAGLVPGLPEEAVRAIVRRAEGIPLYAVETVRMLIAEGKLEMRSGVYVPNEGLSTLAIPETLTALIASRLDSLDPPDRSLVLDAAVLGQSFTRSGLVAVSGIDEAALEPRIRSLVRREILTNETDPRSPERGQYTFVQALIREVAYHTLARSDRKDRHLAAARYFEALDSHEFAGALAGHYLAARDNAAEGPERDALAARARIAYQGAAERAAALGGHDQALEFLDQALLVASDPRDQAELHEQAGGEASVAGRHDAAERHLRAAVEAERAIQDRPAIVGAIASLGRVLLNASNTSAALTVLEPAGIEFADLVGEPNVIALGGQRARAHFQAHDHRRAVEVADQVLAAAEHADLRSIVADTLVTKGTSLAGLGRTIEGLGAIRAGMELAEVLGLTFALIRGYNNRAGIEMDLDPRSALQVAREGLALAGRLGQRGSLAILLSSAAACAVRTGDWQWALAELEAALADDFEPTDRVLLVATRIDLGARRGQPIAGLIRELTGLIDQSTDPGMRAGLDWARAVAALGSGRFVEAREAAHRVAAVQAFNVLDSRMFAARAALWANDADAAREDLGAVDATGVRGPAIDADRTTILAGLAALDGRPADATALYRDGLRMWRALGLAWDEAQVGIDMVTLLDPLNPEVRAAADSAREILVRLEAAPFIELLDAALARSTASPQPQPLG